MSKDDHPRRSPIGLLMVLSVVVTLAGTSVGWAQEAAPQGVIVIRPTDNGFEEFVQAGDPSVDDAKTPDSKIIADAESPTATLTQRLAAMHEPAFRNALASFRGAMGRPITVSVSEPKDMGRFNNSVLRLRHLLAIEQYVLLSEGKVPAALDSFADSFALGDLTERSSLNSMYYGIFVTESSVKLLAAHLDQLSEHDCGQLFLLLKTELSAPNPAIAGFRRDADWNLFLLKGWGSASLKAALNSVGGPEDESQRQQMRNLLKIRQDPNAWSAFQSAVARDLTALADETADGITDYPSPPAGVTTAVPTTDVEQAAQMYTKTFGQFGQPHDGLIERVVTARTYLQLLAVHAAILRWRWETNSVPDSLSALHLGSLATDTFTGQPLAYTRLDSTHYALSSAGPIKRDDNQKPRTDGKREPITLASPGP